MKKTALVFTLATLLLPAQLLALDLNLGGTTLFRFEQRSTPGFDKQLLIPATQYLGADLDKLGDGNLSFHMYGWGRADLADQSGINGTTDASLSYGYLSYNFPKANAQLKAGRFFVFEGGVVENVDGISARADLLKDYEGLALSLYGGKPVKVDRVNDNKGDLIAGGRLSYRVAKLAEFGASILHETGSSTFSLNSATGNVTETQNYRQMAGFDLWLSPHQVLEVTGRSLYNVAAKEVAEHRYQAVIRPLTQLSVAAEYNMINFSGAFASASNPTLFRPDDNDDLTAYGGSLTWAVNKSSEITGDYKHYDRKSKGTSDRAGAEARLSGKDGKFRSGLAYHRLAAAQGINSYHELRGYGSYDPGTYSASLDAIAHLYDDRVYQNTDRLAYEVTASAGYRLKPDIMLSADLSGGRNPQFGNEIKGLVRLSFNYALATKGAGK